MLILQKEYTTLYRNRMRPTSKKATFATGTSKRDKCRKHNEKTFLFQQGTTQGNTSPAAHRRRHNSIKVGNVNNAKLLRYNLETSP